MRAIILGFLLSCFGFSSTTMATPKMVNPKTETVVLITIDGLRWQELFRGADPAFFDQKDFIAHKNHHDKFKKTFWKETPQQRRAVMMPFFWGTIARNGQLYGNRDIGNIGSVTNKHRFSYPGYSEILTGIADDERLKSNEKIPNPNRTVLEWLNDMSENKGKIEAFGSWDVFPYIINEEHSGVPVNAGFEPYDAKGSDKVAFLNDMMKRTPKLWDTVRADVFTMGYARAALDRERMRFLYIALGETDDFAHDGHYDQYIRAAQRSDQAIAELWQWLQNDERYAGKTTLLITVDHGRGYESLEAWKSHGRFPYTTKNGATAFTKYPGDDEIWMAVLGPDTPSAGEVFNGEPVALDQIAATAAKFLGYKYETDHVSLKAGQPISSMFRE